MEYYWTGYGCWGIWMGVWMVITGKLGILGTRKERTTSRNAYAGVFMGFSITSAVFGGAIIIIYSMGIAGYGNWYYYDDDYYRYRDYEYGPTKDYYYRDHRYGTQLALCAVILILGIVEFSTGIWAAVCLCLMKPCTCCYDTHPQQGQMMHTANPGYAMNPCPVGVPAAVPMETGGGMIAVQTVTPVPQTGQRQMVVIPVSGGVGTQSHLVDVDSSGDMTTTVYQPPQGDIPQSSRHGGYMRLKNEQDPVAI
ncbi:hypothetical protein ACROYT_G029882 [Oculina patagonica]